MTKLRHSLLPPPSISFPLTRNVRSPAVTDEPGGCEVDSGFTPPSGDPASGEGLRQVKPKGKLTRRKLPTQFKPKAKRNCLSDHTKQEELRDDSNGKRPTTSVEDAPKERSPLQEAFTPQYPNGFIRISHFGSPRMALTFNNNDVPKRRMGENNPPSITDRVVSASPNVVVRTPFIVRRVNLPGYPGIDSSRREVEGRKLFIIRSGSVKAVSSGSAEDSGPPGAGLGSSGGIPPPKPILTPSSSSVWKSPVSSSLKLGDSGRSSSVWKSPISSSVKLGDSGRSSSVWKSPVSSSPKLGDSGPNSNNSSLKFGGHGQNLGNSAQYQPQRNLSGFRVYSRNRPEVRTVKAQEHNQISPKKDLGKSKTEEGTQKRMIRSLSQVDIPSRVSSSVTSQENPGNIPQARMVKSLSQNALTNDISVASPVNGKENAIPPQDTKNRMTRSLSQNALPSINFNTLSKNHYKTVFGSPSQFPGRRLSSPTNKGSYHFVINSMKKENCAPQPEGRNKPEKESGRQPSFIRMLETTSDNCSTDSELESIFGDAFNFTRPKILVKKLS